MSQRDAGTGTGAREVSRPSPPGLRRWCVVRLHVSFVKPEDPRPRLVSPASRDWPEGEVLDCRLSRRIAPYNGLYSSSL